MNKEKLLKLSDTLRGIAEGAEWEYTGVHPYDEEWLEARNNEDPLILVCQFERQIRLKPQPDPYAELKAAHAAGKKLQHRYSGMVSWEDCSVSDAKQDPYCFIHGRECYRIKPEPQKLPLCADDVRAGAQFLSKCGQIWFPNHIREGYVCFGHFMSLTFQELIDDEWKIRCAGETEWRPCYKLVEQ